MAVVVIGFVDLFKDLGTSAAVIQCRDINDDLLSSVFWANATFGAVASAVLAVAAPIAAVYYHEPRVISVLRVLCLTFVVSGLSILQQTLFERKMAFNVLAKIEVAGVVCGALVGIGSAVFGAGVWALVAQSLTNATLVTVLLWWFSDWHPQFVFHWGEIRRISHYSLNLAGYNILNYFSRNADYLLIGRFLGAAPLGIYTLAYRIMFYPLQIITVVISRVMFPVYSQLQENDARFRSAYLRTVALIALITFPMMVGIWSVTEPFVLSVFGAMWAPAIPLVRILAPVGMVQSIGATVGAIYRAKDRTNVMFRWGVASSVVIVCGFIVGLHWELLGIAVAYAVVNLLLIAPTLMIPFRFIGLHFADLAVVLSRPLIGSLVMAAVLLTIRSLLGSHSEQIKLEVLVISGVVSYLIAMWVLSREQLYQVAAIMGLRHELR
jgi:PST family polysaccharide transporter